MKYFNKCWRKLDKIFCEIFIASIKRIFYERFMKVFYNQSCNITGNVLAYLLSYWCNIVGSSLWNISWNIVMSITINLHFCHSDVIFQRVYLVVVLIESLKKIPKIVIYIEDVKTAFLEINVWKLNY